MLQFRAERVQMLFTKCIIKEVEPRDGYRISVMSRHTLDDGKTPDLRIKSWDVHYPLLGPSPRLIGEYKRGCMSWAKFARRYRLEIRDSFKLPNVLLLARFAFDNDVTILCIEETAEYCHRRLLAEECRKLVPELRIEHR